LEFLLHHLLTLSAGRFPDNTAVTFNDQSVSYYELNQLTNKLANILRKNGINRGDRVGIYINKSIQSIISIFGILKAGAVYVPLDSKAPLSRISYIIQNCAISGILTSLKKINDITKLIFGQESIKFIVNTDNSPCDTSQLGIKIIEWEAVIKESNIWIDYDSPIETDLAYILYTSGSTGVPKGVMISHLNSLTFIRWVQSTFDINSNDVLSSHAPLHFDLSILDIFGAIQAGATIALVPEMLSAFPMKLVDWVYENRITIWYSVPSILIMMLLHGSITRHKFERLRTIIFAGEVFPVKHLRNLMAEFPNVDFFNLYGPTETNVITYYKVDNIPPDRENPLPIGKACSNMQVFAIQDNGEIVNTPGVEGELYARGSCIAQGYWNDPEKSSKNFLWNPLQMNYQERCYRTGDIVTMDANGDFIFKSRRDHMIKSRGYRIEIGEIEAALYANPAIKESAVVAIPDELIGNKIKAFVVLNSGHDMDAAILRAYCSKKIPQYMIPEEIEFCHTLPRTSSGKTDKLALLKRNE
jgi:amino acid adenylation domain-containing protein